MNQAKTKDELRSALDQAEWSWIKPHYLRDAVIVVAAGLDILDVAVAVANDEAAKVNAWISRGALSKPTPKDVSEWDGNEGSRKFSAIVIQPYVLIQPIHSLS